MILRPSLLSVASFVVFVEKATVRPAGLVAVKAMVSVPLEAAGSGESVSCGKVELVPGATSIGSGVASRTKSNANSEEVEEDVDVVDVAELVDEVVIVEEVEEADEEDDVVEELEEAEVVLKID